jgi:inosine-uridine nucleoside N-ribohydrolase
MIPSILGRNKAHITETHVKQINQINDAGRFLYEMYQTYWEPGYKDKRIAMNDTCAYVYVVAPELFTAEKVDFDVDLVDLPGKTIVNWNKNGKGLICTQINRQKYLEFLEEKIHVFDNIKLKK